ncbi:MAG TPA: hypothetical protein VKV25_09215, partial [Acidimicrobiales bacterium]|nr:hypothetical protein [Acidimicrobiales bacterium]
LPVSNLTNLIAASNTGASAVTFLVHLGPPSLVASGAGWLCYRRAAPRLMARRSASRPVLSGAAVDEAPLDAAERSALRLGGAVVLGVLVGFVLGRDVGIVEWQVAVAADVLLLLLLRFRGPEWRPLPWRSVPVGTALVAAALGVLATAAVAHVDVGSLLGGDSVGGLARTAGVAALGANVVNNLPALLVLLPSYGHHAGASLWAALLGVNMGPVLVVTGTLASLLWLETLASFDVPVRRSDVTLVGVLVGLPAAAAGVGTLLVLRAAGVSA